MNEPRPRILAIDDTPQNLLTLGAALAAEFDLQVATSGPAGLALAKASPPDLILLDVMMPGMDGHEVCRQIKADPALRRVPVIFVTALSDIDDEAAGLALGAADYLSKPINVEVARHRIRNLLERERFHQEVETQRDELATLLAERKTAERALDGFFEQALNLHLVSRLDGTVLRLNTGWQHNLGYPADDLLGKSFLDLVHPDDLPATLAELEKLGRGQTTFRFENRYRHADGSYRCLAWSATAAPQDNLVFAMGTDITERRAAEVELKRYRAKLEALVAERTAALSIACEAAEAANRAKSAFLASMSHELRTPLNGIMGMTDLARRRATDPQQIAQLGRAAQASTHLLAVINDILDIARIEANRLDLKLADVDAAGLLNDLAHLLSQQATEKGLTLALDIDPRLAHLSQRADPMRLRQILLNLAGNAIKFTHEGGVTLAARVAQEHPDDVLLRFEVRDTGIGIAAEDQARLFTPFHQVDDSLTRGYGGSGLGLAICKRLAEAMGGSMGVESRPGAGSTFWFNLRLGKARAAEDTDLPQITPPAQALTSEEVLKTHFAGARVLLVEDEPISQEVARFLLAEAGLQVDVADDGAQAVERVRQEPYELILMDMQMPTMNGLDATRAIRALPGFETLPIVAMTANAFAEDRQNCLAAGMTDFMTKPFDPELLFTTVARWLARRAPHVAATPADAASNLSG